jgi:hypothetical protein
MEMAHKKKKEKETYKETNKRTKNKKYQLDFAAARITPTKRESFNNIDFFFDVSNCENLKEFGLV